MELPNLTMLVAVDIGNTLTKLYRFDAQAGDFPKPAQTIRLPTRSIAGDVLENAWTQLLTGVVDDSPGLPWRVSSVHRGAEQGLAAWVARFRPHDDYRRLSRRDIPLTLDVENPDGVGVDRLLAAAAANHLRPLGRPAIVVAAGSAVTVDLLSADGVFLGGAILPGFAMSARALAGHADALPLVDFSKNEPLPSPVGKSTWAAIRSGVEYGSLGAVRELIQRFVHFLNCPPVVFLTGGDMNRLGELTDVCRVPDLVAAGIALAQRAIAKS